MKEKLAPLQSQGDVVRVVIADDTEGIRIAIQHFLKSQPDIDVVGTAANGNEALNLVRQLKPDLAILDVMMPEKSGIQAARAIAKTYPEVRTIALSVHCDKRLVMAMLEAGVQGYVTKEDAETDLPLAIRTVTSGGRYFSDAVAANLDSETLREATVGVAFAIQSEDIYPIQ